MHRQIEYNSAPRCITDRRRWMHTKSVQITSRNTSARPSIIYCSLAHKITKDKSKPTKTKNKNKNPTLIQSEIRSKKRVVFNIRQASCLGGSSKWLTTHTSTFYITVSPEKQTTKLVQRKKEISNELGRSSHETQRDRDMVWKRV